MIKIINLSYQNEKKTIFKKLNLTLSNSVIKISGKSGIGKTTLVKIIANELSNYNGTIETTTNFKYVMQNVKEIFLQNEAVSIIFEISQIMIEDDIKNFNLTYEKFTKTPSQLSGGELQRIVIYYMYKNHAIESIIFDESFSAIDQKLATKIFRKIELENRFKQIILIDHHLKITENNNWQIIELLSKVSKE